MIILQIQNPVAYYTNVGIYLLVLKASIRFGCEFPAWVQLELSS